MKLIYSLLTFTTLFSLAFAQTTITEKEFVQQVLANHPVAKQASFAAELGENKLLKARGWFDPKISADYKQKSFDGKNYYQVLDNNVKIPTWIGLDVKLNYTYNDGTFLNPENNLPSNGLYSAGLEMPLLKGLIFDKRRADLQQGKNYVELGKLERQQILNQLVFDASKAYWDWYLAYKLNEVAKQGVELAEITYDAVKTSVEYGDKAAIDTLEALIQIQNRQLLQTEAELELQNARLWISVFLWTEENNPATLKPNTLPDEPKDMNSEILLLVDSFANNPEKLALNNPKIQQFNYKIKNLEVEQKLKREMLRPSLNLGYNFITQPFDETIFDQFNIGNYKWNVNFSMPLLFRKERAELKIAKLQLQNTDLEYKTALLQQQNKINAVVNKINTLQNQLQLSNKNVSDNALLVTGEKRKFNIGESSLFLVNYREVNYLKNLQKLAEIETKLQISMAQYYFETNEN